VHLTVMTYNVGNGLADPARLATLLPETEADIVGLQELAAVQAELLVDVLGGMYPYKVLVPTGFSGKGCPATFRSYITNSFSCTLAGLTFEPPSTYTAARSACSWSTRPRPA
jgi:hypothetical protein